ncbi:acyl-CoA dehydrogenase family protein [Actinomadura viridis]|uniref:acyl-CoA dehydrogenase family protein n=1 Tax=Actinomadura viridis TaxID=58110 RepID=UPI0036975E36
MSTDHHRLREKVRAFADAEVTPRVPDMEHAATVDTELATLIAQQGWIGVTIPATFGGMGAGHLAKTIIIEELSRASGAMGAMIQASQLGTAKILHFGNQEQQRSWLPKIAAGSCLPTIAVTEPDSGSHVLGMRSTARRDGDEYVLTGRKIYVGNSHIGHLHGIVARTDPDSQGARSLSAFLVESDRPGLRVLPHRPAMGLHGFSFGELVLEECRVPAANLLGDIGDGLDIAYSSSILYGRPNLTAVALGLHQALVDQALAYVRERRLYGGPLAELPTIRHKIGLMKGRLMTARLAAYHAAHMLDRGSPCDLELINAKHLNAKAAQEAAYDAMDIHGAAGLFTDRPLERIVRDIHHVHAPAGTSDIQILRLAQGALQEAHHPQWSQRFAHSRTQTPTTSRQN